MAFEFLILELVSELQTIESRVYPWMVACGAEVSVSVRTVRRYMARMAEDGRLMRLGPRGGYLAS